MVYHRRTFILNKVIYERRLHQAFKIKQKKQAQMAKKDINHHANARVFYKKLKKDWLKTQKAPDYPCPMVKLLFDLASEHASKKRRLVTGKTYVFKHKSFTKHTAMKQRYRVTGFGQLVLIPSAGFNGAEELSSSIMYL